ncbi:MAG: adenylate/guanylate cyclase domain-containing protein [Planctomycetota bacterium]|nr:adenylate/guanylate cyclase domain-containing protein [Planctomycetota bacterium]
MDARAARVARLPSIRRAFTTILVLGVTLPAVLIWGVGRMTAGEAVGELWEQLSHELTGHAVQRTLRYVETGRSALGYNRGLLEQGTVDPQDRKGLLRYLLRGLQANPNVSWYTYAGPDGAYLSAYRKPGGGTVLTWREQVEGGARYRDFEVQDDGSWKSLPEKVKAYDPRTRGWYEQAAASEDPVWSKVFLFASGPPGFILSQAQRQDDGALAAVWAIEYEMSYVSTFLETLAVGESGRAYLLTREGDVVGHPLSHCCVGTVDDWLVTETDGKKRIASAVGNKDTWLATAYGVLQDRGGGETNFGFELDGKQYLAAATPFPESTQLPWQILLVIPEKDILGNVQKGAFYSALWALLIALGVLAFGVWYANRRISKPLAAIAGELDRMARLDLGQGAGLETSNLEEVQNMLSARDRMRGGLKSFTKYVPAKLVRDLLEQGLEARLGGESKPLTIMFSDVVGFTAISEQLGEPQALVDALGDYLEAMSASIAECGGTVDKYIGDAVMAFWGAPDPVPDHPLQAVRAAWLCQRRLEALRTSWPEGHPAFYTRIGVHTGEVVVGNIGWEGRMNYTVMGDTVNLASRLEALCQRYGINTSLSEDTYRASEHEFLARPVDCVAVKGKEEPVVVYELLGPRAEVDDDTRAFCEATTEGFAHYRARAFDAAVEAYERALASRPGDAAATQLLERCQGYVATPPPADWDGVLKLTSK